MNEHGFIKSIHRRIPSAVYAWKINDNYQGGVADAYYSGNKGDLWVEYKYLKSLPKRDNTKLQFGLTAQQILWLNSRRDEGRHVVVVVGFAESAIILTDKAWNNQLTKADIIRIAIERADVARYIVESTHTTVGTLRCAKSPSTTGRTRGD